MGRIWDKILNTLKDLSKDDFDAFCRKLCDESREPRIRKCETERKSRFQIADLLLSRCMESGAVDRTVQTLRDIGCNEEAWAIAGGAPSGSPPQQKEHFVDRHRNDLINRVNGISSILDQLLSKKVINQEQYDKVRTIKPTQEQMRFLFSGPLNAGGRRSKDVFISILEKVEPFLMNDLRGDNNFI